MADPVTMLAVLQFVGTATTAVCNMIDKLLEFEHERDALKDLRKSVESLKSDTVVYKALMNIMETDTDFSGLSPYTRFIQRYVIGLCSSSYAHRANAISQTGWKGSNGRP
jgi:hypothetical protein